METTTREKCDILAMPRTVTVYRAVFLYNVHSVLEPNPSQVIRKPVHAWIPKGVVFMKPAEVFLA